jgi:hypothetical protein
MNIHHIGAVVKSCGCLYHPLALRVLAGPVIEELDREYKKYETDHSTYFQGLRESYDKAITLLKGGVKK